MRVGDRAQVSIIGPSGSGWIWVDEGEATLETKLPYRPFRRRGGGEVPYRTGPWTGWLVRFADVPGTHLRLVREKDIINQQEGGS